MPDKQERLSHCVEHQTKTEIRLDSLEKEVEEIQKGREADRDVIRELHNWQSKALLVITIVMGIGAFIFEVIKSFIVKKFGG